MLNSWEACYFKIDERKLLQLAKAGADVGIELFVMDDGCSREKLCGLIPLTKRSFP